MFYLDWQHIFVYLSVCIGDEQEWDRQCVWHSELVSGLDKLDVCMEQLQQDKEKWTTHGGDWNTPVHVMVRLMALWSILRPAAQLSVTQLGQMLTSLSSHQCQMHMTNYDIGSF